jgi:hypothetical protein
MFNSASSLAYNIFEPRPVPNYGLGVRTPDMYSSIFNQNPTTKAVKPVYTSKSPGRLVIKSDTVDKVLTNPIENSATEDQTQLIELLKNAFLATDTVRHNFRGHSYCRICGNTRNGYSEFEFGNFSVPEGYLHYLRDHNVAIDPDLKEYLLHGTEPATHKVVGFWKGNKKFLGGHSNNNGGTTSYKAANAKKTMEAYNNLLAQRALSSLTETNSSSEYTDSSPSSR